MKAILRQVFKIFGYSIVPNGTLAIDVRQLRNIPYYHSLMQMIKDVPGSVVECGVGKGRTFLYFSHLINDENIGRKLWGFDSFEGFPQPTVEDMSPRNPKKGEWSGVSQEDIKCILRSAGLPQKFIDTNIVLVKGYVEETLQKYDGQPIALLHIDLDLYSGYKHVLDTLVGFVAEGGMVVFDEYGERNWPGATQAVDEFLSAYSWTLETHPFSGKRYFIKTNS